MPEENESIPVEDVQSEQMNEFEEAVSQGDGKTIVLNQDQYRVVEDETEDEPEGEVGDLQPESPENAEDAPEDTTVDTPAIVLFHPILGHPGVPKEIPEQHTMWLGANITISTTDSSLMFGPNNFIVSGDTPEGIADRVRLIVYESLKDMLKKTRIIQTATPDQVPPTDKGKVTPGGIVLP